MEKEKNSKKLGLTEVKSPSKISEFFNHMLAYGGFNINEGVMHVWGDPSLFIPVEAFVIFFHELEKTLGEKIAHDIFYWLGRLTGRNATETLIKRFGVDKSDIPDFVNGATQDGMGYLKIKEYDQKKFDYGLIIGTNSTFALEYAKKYGETKNSIDFYLSGILAGGSEPLFDKFYDVEEKECMAKGDDSCVYEIKSLKDRPEMKFFNNLNLIEIDIINKTRLLMMKRKASFKILGKKDITFGDGTFTLSKIKGINLMNYAKVVLDKILELKLKEKKLSIDTILVREFIRAIKDRIIKKDLKTILKELEIFGYGKFNIKFAGTKKILLSNSNNPYPSDYVEIFGRSRIPIDNFICLLLKEAFAVNNKKVEIKETQCRAKGDKECSFDIDFI